MNKAKQPGERHCHECGRPIGGGHRGFGLCRDCDNEFGVLIRSEERGWKSNERREVRTVQDSVCLDDVFTQHRKRRDGQTQPPRRKEYLPVYERLEMGEVNGVTRLLEGCNADVA